MEQSGGIKLFLMFAIGLFCIIIGLNGKLGSFLGAVIDPASMTESSNNGGQGGSNGNTSTLSYQSSSSVASTIRSVFGVYANDALRIANAESTLDPKAYNSISIGGSHAEGVFQILYPSTWNTTSYAAGNPYDATANIKAAYEIFRRDGYSWREWATAPALGLS